MSTDPRVSAAEQHARQVFAETGDTEAALAAYREAIDAQAPAGPAEPVPNPPARQGDPSPFELGTMDERARLELERTNPGVTDRVFAGFVHDQREAERERDPRTRAEQRRREQDEAASDPLANELAVKRQEFERRQQERSRRAEIERRHADTHTTTPER